MMATVGYIVRGKHGSMWQSTRDRNLYFGHKGRTTIFPDRKSAVKAVDFTKLRNPDKPWLDMWVCRVEAAELICGHAWTDECDCARSAKGAK